MHDEAILISGSGKVASPGSLVMIGSVERVYKFTGAVNGLERFKCADKTCGVPVIAVIIQPKKHGRKKSPSSHFRASPMPHRPGCTRKASGVATSNLLGGGANPASPTKGPFPTKWTSPLKVTSISAASGPLSSGRTSNSASSTGNRRSRSGAGTSKSSSSRVERFASSWDAMTPTLRTSTELTAPWNPGGTYASAFRDLAMNPLGGKGPTPMRIYKGTATRVHRGSSGYLIWLSERHSNGEELVFWIQNGVETSGPSGAALWARLTANADVVGSAVFALGAFTREARRTRSWYSLPVREVLDIWLA